MFRIWLILACFVAFGANAQTGTYPDYTAKSLTIKPNGGASSVAGISSAGAITGTSANISGVIQGSNIENLTGAVDTASPAISGNISIPRSAYGVPGYSLTDNTYYQTFSGTHFGFVANSSKGTPGYSAITSMSWANVSGGQLTIVATNPTFVTAIGNTVVIVGATNTGTGGTGVVNGSFTVAAFTDSQHFVVTATGTVDQFGTIGVGSATVGITTGGSYQSGATIYGGYGGGNGDFFTAGQSGMYAATNTGGVNISGHFTAHDFEIGIPSNYTPVEVTSLAIGNSTNAVPSGIRTGIRMFDASSISSYAGTTDAGIQIAKLTASKGFQYGVLFGDQSVSTSLGVGAAGTLIGSISAATSLSAYADFSNLSGGTTKCGICLPDGSTIYFGGAGTKVGGAITSATASLGPDIIFGSNALVVNTYNDGSTIASLSTSGIAFNYNVGVGGAYSGTYALNVIGSSYVSGSATFASEIVAGAGTPTGGTAPAIGVKQFGNGDDMIFFQRATDTAPAGYFLRGVNAADSSNLFIIDASGNLTLAGGITMGATAGVSCSGAPTGSFASVNGIVTHC